jgi:predicted DsbA family dithiol-disulfide isomerase
MLASKYGVSLEQAAAMHARVTAVASGEGLVYRLDQAQRGNTFDAHRLEHLAAARGLQDVVVERLFSSYFTEGRPIGDRESLVATVAEVGLDTDEARAVLAGDAYAAEVRADEQRGAAFGITGVPFVVIDERYGVSGAQTPDVFVEALEQAWADAHRLTTVGVTGEEAGLCEDDQCAIDPPTSP